MIRSPSIACIFPILVAAQVFAPAVAPAFANEAEARSCASTLSPAAQQIYRAAAPDMPRATDMDRLLRSKVTPMVMSGEMNRTTARLAATAASICLRSLQQPPQPASLRTALTSSPGFGAPNGAPQ
jgi:hypothetical protein